MLNWDEYDESTTAPKPKQAQQEVQQAPVPVSENAQELFEENFMPVESGNRAKQAKDLTCSIYLVFPLPLVPKL